MEIEEGVNNTPPRDKYLTSAAGTKEAGAANENIVQKHLNIALLNVF